MRDTATQQTVWLDKGQGNSEAEEGHAVFQTANEEGTRVFFTDTERLTEESGEAGKPDLYVCEIVENASHELECKLTDLTPVRDTGEGQESADVVHLGHSGVLGASRDGSYVYFVAEGVLSETANARGEKAARGLCESGSYKEALCNIYVEHYDATAERWQPPRFVAAVAGGRHPTGDEFDW